MYEKKEKLKTVEVSTVLKIEDGKGKKGKRLGAKQTKGIRRSNEDI